MTRRPSFGMGFLWGVLFTLPLVAVLSIGSAIANFSFLPNDLFNWLPNILPGPVLTAGIDGIVGVVRGFNLGPTDSTAKTIEQIMAIGLLIVIGGIAGALFFAIMNRIAARTTALIPGILLGVLTGLPLLLIGLSVNNFPTVAPIVTAIWTIALYVLWGAALSWFYHMLRYRVSSPVLARETALREAEAPVNNINAIDRRTFMIQVGGATATLAVVGAGISALLNRGDAVETIQSVAQVPPESAPSETGETIADATAEALPNANDPVVPVAGTRPEVTPLPEHYRIDIRATPLEIPAEGYVLPIRAAGETLREFTLDEIRALPATDAYITMSCISNPVGGDLISTIRWTGVSMQRFLEAIEVPAEATHMLITSGDNFDETLALEAVAADERILLAYAWEGVPLTAKHGFPLRIHFPDHYGMKQPKWITQIEFINQDQDGYWVRRGWDKVAQVRATSVIDTIDTAAIDDGSSTMVSVGGMAWAGARGLSLVEVQVDDGEWQPAQLRAPISERTWQLWRYEWPFEPGNHTFTVRMTEADGTPQITNREGVRPSGATGLHDESETFASV